MAGRGRPENLTNAGKGRPKGAKNKATVSMKQAFAEAFDELGGAEALAKWAKEDPKTFYQLASKLIPVQLQGEMSGALEIIHRSE